jgi:hypothetical protein
MYFSSVFITLWAVLYFTVTVLIIPIIFIGGLIKSDTRKITQAGIVLVTLWILDALVDPIISLVASRFNF